MTSDSTTRQPTGRTAILCHLPNLRCPAWAACPVPSSSLGAPQDPQVGQEGAQADSAPPEGTAHSLLLSLMTSAFSGSSRGPRENRTRGADFGDISTAIPGAGTQNQPLKRKLCSPGAFLWTLRTEAHLPHFSGCQGGAWISLRLVSRTLFIRKAGAASPQP